MNPVRLVAVAINGGKKIVLLISIESCRRGLYVQTIQYDYSENRI